MPGRTNDDIHSIFSRIDEKEASMLVQEMVRIPSVNPPGNEAEIGRYYFKKIREAGLDAGTFESLTHRPNVIGRLKGTEGHSSLMFNGHLDVVPPGDLNRWTVEPFGGEMSDGRVYGRGSADMRGGLAAMILAAKAIRESGVELRGDLLLTAVVDEEVTGRGANDLVNKGYVSDMVVVCEPTGLKPLRAHKGILWLEITTLGKAVHSSRVSSRGVFGDVNAIYKMTDVIRALQDHLAVLERRSDPVVGNPTISVGTIEGGSKTNIVPDRCTISVDRRVLPYEDPDAAKAEVKEILRQLGAADPEMKIRIHVVASRRGAVTPADAAIVRLSKTAAEEVLGEEVEVSGSPATSDMEVFVNRVGVPTVMLGPGRIGTAHIVDEYIEIDQVVAAAKIYVLMALKALG
jgi:succinyl-diaminopimelate desuccinylase